MIANVNDEYTSNRTPSSRRLQPVRYYEFLTSTQKSPPPPVHPDPEWIFAALFGALGFVAAGCAAFRVGYHRFAPDLPPGTSGCGNCALGGLFIMLIGAPIVALAFSVVAGGIGAILDCLLDRYRPMRLEL